MNRNYTIKQILPIEPGWYVSYDNDNEYDRVIGVYLIEIQWDDKSKSYETMPMTRYGVDMDLTVLDIWIENGGGYNTGYNMEFIKDCHLQSYINPKKK